MPKIMIENWVEKYRETGSVDALKNTASPWAGVSPGNDESAGKKTSKTTQGDKALKTMASSDLQLTHPLVEEKLYIIMI
ncbi:hypothetical protein [Peribacillus sp. NPDC096540]|uniref:hypothetical protein n=1 Tax=Peribacillus sp. NPDC096540 TaxID=3390612 RepID=UPI003D0170F7